MPYLLVGAGQAGSAIVDEVYEHKNISKIAHPIVINSTIRDLQNLSNIESDRWYGVAEQHGLIEGNTAGFEEQVTGGFGRNPVRADEVMATHSDAIYNALDDQLGRASASEFESDSRADVPFAFLFVGLGGGTGCGISPYIADAIKNYTDGVAKVIAVCVLPNTQGPVGEDSEEATPSRQAWNARYGLDRLEETVDGMILVDNQRLAYHNAAEGQFTEYNEFVAGGIVDLISGPILERIDRSEYDVDPPIIDLQDIVTSLSFGAPGGDQEPGYASLCRSVMMTKSLSGYLLPFAGKKEITATDLWDRARLKQTLDDVELDDTQKAIGLLRSPARYIRDNEYRIDTSKFRSTFTVHCNEVNLGVTLTKRNLASFTALLTYERADISRIQEIEELAAEYEQQAEFDEQPSQFEPTAPDPSEVSQSPQPDAPPQQGHAGGQPPQEPAATGQSAPPQQGATANSPPQGGPPPEGGQPPQNEPPQGQPPQQPPDGRAPPRNGGQPPQDGAPPPQNGPPPQGQPPRNGSQGQPPQQPPDQRPPQDGSQGPRSDAGQSKGGDEWRPPRGDRQPTDGDPPPQGGPPPEQADEPPQQPQEQREDRGDPER